MRWSRLAWASLGLPGLAGCLLSIDDARVGASDDGGMLGRSTSDDAPAEAVATGDGQGVADTSGAMDATDATTPGDAGANDAPESGFDAEADAPRCAAGMVAVTTAAGGSYCIGATEVTHGDYAVFLAAAPAPTASNQLPECAWNATYEPAQWNAGGDPALPVGGLDWCDAYAYCASVPGRHLCGAIGGGPVEYQTGVFDATQSEWFNACSHGGDDAFPYGASYGPTACNGLDYGAGVAVQAGSLATCVGGFPGLFDLSGNVEEWANSCTSASSPCPAGTGHQCDLCRGLGGAYDTDASFLACKGGDQFYRGTQLTDTGLRCCAN
ncbi:MAG TPA: SUMF1/EgtB/PvdO family nonheme iron enzyme [Polyangiaceae bacterium]|nr:SUMF1/EgtB/PvdO family nonheme iron enzyme [Polyangiaceae bacterium]